MARLKKIANWLSARSTSYVEPAYELGSELFTELRTLSKTADIDDDDSRIRYEKLAEKFSPDMRDRWKNYVKTVMAVWVVAVLCLVNALISLEWLTILESLAFFAAVWVCLGYRIWVLREKRFPPFFQYLKLVPRTIKSALPFGAMDLMG